VIMAADSTITVHQTVHGYRAGHELLQSSMAVPPDVQRTLLIQSDLSGPTLASGFEEYMSGYPLDSLGAYVLARTWYAPEMDRPGCVWTHSLLIAFADLASVTTLSALAPVFRRPTRADAYAVSTLPPLTFTLSDSPNRLDDQALLVAPRLIAALYGACDRTVVLFGADASVFEGLVLAVWSQQWPRLRRSFRFCTGALASRVQGDVAFDLLVAPSSLRTRIQREIGSRAVAVPGDAEPLIPVWVASGLLDVQDEQPTLREFLWSYGADSARPRQAWRPLVEIYELLRAPTEAPSTLKRLVDLLGGDFPTADDGKRLKIDALGLEPKLQKVVDHEAVLLVLATTEHAASFSERDLQLGAQARELWQADRASATRLLLTLLTAHLNRLGEAILVALCEEVGPTSAIELEKVQHGILSVLLERSPSLASAPTIWRLSLDRQREFLDILARRGSDAVRSAVGAMIFAGTSDLAGDVARVLGAESAEAILSAADDDEDLLSRAVGRGWSEILARDSSGILGWLRRTPASPNRLAFAVRHLDPHQAAVRAWPPAAWLAAAGDGLEAMPDDARVRTAAFVLAIGLATPAAEGAALVALSYAQVYRATETDSLPYDAWRLLDDDLPPLSWWRRWDRCERLAIGLVDRFARFDWPVQALFQAASDRDALRQALDVGREQPRTRDLLSRIKTEFRQGTLELNDVQRQLLHDRL
jgi:hypothetical protein